MAEKHEKGILGSEIFYGIALIALLALIGNLTYMIQYLPDSLHSTGAIQNNCGANLSEPIASLWTKNIRVVEKITTKMDHLIEQIEVNKQQITEHNQEMALEDHRKTVHNLSLLLNELKQQMKHNEQIYGKIVIVWFLKLFPSACIKNKENGEFLYADQNGRVYTASEAHNRTQRIWRVFDCQHNVQNALHFESAPDNNHETCYKASAVLLANDVRHAWRILQVENGFKVKHAYYGNTLLCTCGSGDIQRVSSLHPMAILGGVSGSFWNVYSDFILNLITKQIHTMIERSICLQENRNIYKSLLVLLCKQ